MAQETVRLLPLIKQTVKGQIPELLDQILTHNTVSKINILFAGYSKVSGGAPNSTLNPEFNVEVNRLAGHSVLENPYKFTEWVLSKI